MGYLDFLCIFCINLFDYSYFCQLKIRKFRMIGSQENIMLGLIESPRTAFSTKSIALLLNEKRDNLLTKKLNYYVQKGLLLNPRKGIYAKKTAILRNWRDWFLYHRTFLWNMYFKRRE